MNSIAVVPHDSSARHRGKKIIELDSFAKMFNWVIMKICLMKPAEIKSNTTLRKT